MSGKLKKRLKKNALLMCKLNEEINGNERQSAFIFSNVSMSFYQPSFAEVIKNPDWVKRINKKHTHFKDGTLEMQSSNSSDAILMNIFCNPSISMNDSLKKYLDIKISNSQRDIVFGWNPEFENESNKKPTEIDMKIGNHIFEAKLTENSFTKKNVDVLMKYPLINEIFFFKKIEVNQNKQVKNYQLFRNIITAYKYNFKFTILIDETRLDLIKEINNVKEIIKDEDLKARINFMTWQGIVKAFDNEFKNFMKTKYF